MFHFGVCRESILHSVLPQYSKSRGIYLLDTNIFSMVRFLRLFQRNIDVVWSGIFYYFLSYMGQRDVSAVRAWSCAPAPREVLMRGTHLGKPVLSRFLQILRHKFGFVPERFWSVCLISRSSYIPWIFNVKWHIKTSKQEKKIWGYIASVMLYAIQFKLNKRYSHSKLQPL